MSEQEIECCEACPFSSSELAAAVQNYGCLPTAQENVNLFDRIGRSISCHEKNVLCRGLLRHRPEAAAAPIIPYPKWYISEDFKS